ncbi:GNAT family N-acetyltransferase [Oculatella sp. LEGE 06141]|uniref:GNAT family N-acetyltransferase n=1 Tax=Oculatella sp. LEGE 06141 TaxID=1828648 RepID=UPI001882FDEF|nr:GNAT family N-acetyltransferase [Oculatella sp. LEGE 06141]MBE9179212.1 GNAT family N-acetyltransferase [Oculatella sp. LEGE 06141]
MPLTEVKIQSDRLLLQPISLQYKEAIFTEFTAAITTYMHSSPPAHPAEAEFWINGALRQLKNGSDLSLAVLQNSTQTFLGCAGLHNIHHPAPELGIWIKQSAHGHHYGREAIAALKQWADEHLNYEYLLYPVDQNNIPSRKIPESLGGKVARHYTKTNMSGRQLAIVEYRIFSSTM